MTFTMRAVTTAAATAVIAAAGVLPSSASADTQVVPFGHSAEIVTKGGSQVIDYTVGTLTPSGHNDGIWYSEVTARGVKGSPTPVIADFNARAANGSTYWVMKGNEPDGLPNGPIPAGREATGKLYFDVRLGTAPDSVVYRDAAGADEAVWKG